MTHKGVAFLASAGVLAACAQLPIVTGADYAPASSIMNGLKCELGQFMSNNPDLPTWGWKLVGMLDLRIAEESGSSGGVKGDSIVTFQPAAFNFDYGTGLTRKRTRAATFEFSLAGKGTMTACLTDEKGEFYFINPVTGLPDKSTVVQGIGLDRWLEALDGVTAHGPAHTPSKYTYALTFAVASESSLDFGGKLTVIPITLSTNNYAKREDIQVLTMTFAPAPSKPGKPDPIEIRIVGDAREDKAKEGASQWAPSSKDAPSRGPASISSAPRAPAKVAPQFRIPEETRRDLQNARDRLFTY